MPISTPQFITIRIMQRLISSKLCFTQVYICISFSTYTCLSLSVNLSSTTLSVCLSIQPSISSIYSSICLSIYQTQVSVDGSIYLRMPKWFGTSLSGNHVRYEAHGKHSPHSPHRLADRVAFSAASSTLQEASECKVGNWGMIPSQRCSFKSCVVWVCGGS